MSLVQIINGPSFNAAAEDDVLSAGLKAGVYLEHSCRTGRCNSCKAKLIAGQTFIVLPELGLTQQEVEQGHILACCRKPVGNVVIEAEYLDVPQIKATTHPCKIDALDFSDDVAHLVLRLPPKDCFLYYPGQYVGLARAMAPVRSYSIASALRSDGKLEFYIKRQPGGIFGEYLFNAAKIGDLLKLVGPAGSFFYRNDKVKNLIFLATGTGIAPVKAILEEISKTPDTDVTVNLYWGNRHPSSFCWQPNSSVTSNIKLNYTQVVSRSNAAWIGAQGHVQDILLKDIKDFSDAAVYACGSEAMIHDAKRALLEHGLPQNKFYSDSFVAAI